MGRMRAAATRKKRAIEESIVSECGKDCMKRSQAMTVGGCF